MKNTTKKILTAAAAAFALSGAMAGETMKGRIDVVDPTSQTIVVAGITFEANKETNYDTSLQSFDSLQQGQKVKLDFVRDGGKYIVKEIELEG